MLHSFAISPKKGLHSERGPSTAHRWRPCPGSVRKSRGIPNVAGIEAAYGTVFHEFAAHCLELGVGPYGFVGAMMTVDAHGVIEFDHEMAVNMLPGLDVLNALEGPGCIMVVEQIVDLREWVGEDEFGTTDCVIIDFENNRIIIFDWKYGAGIPVSPNYNDQAILYFLGAWSSFIRAMWLKGLYDRYLEVEGPRPRQRGAPQNLAEFEMDLGPSWADEIEVQVMIEQPRAPGGGGTWITDVATLLEEGEKIRRDAKRTEDFDAPVVPGEKQCKFCPAARVNSCEERAAYISSMIGADLDSLHDGFVEGEEIEFPRALTPEARSQIIIHAPMIKQYLAQLDAEAHSDAERGKPTPGLKLVEGRRPDRKWSDEAKAKAVLLRRLGDDAFKPRELVTPMGAQKLVGKAVFDAVFARQVTQGDARTILVTDFHPGETIQSFSDAYDDLQELDEPENLNDLSDLV